MLKSLLSLAGALVIVLAVGLVPAAAQAQTAAAPAASSSFDGYRAAAITAGVVGGAVVATIITDGLILPIIASGGNNMAGMAANLVSVAGTVYGAVAGGLYADQWYGKQ